MCIITQFFILSVTEALYQIDSIMQLLTSPSSTMQCS